MFDDRTTPLFTFQFDDTDALSQLLTRLFDPLEEEKDTDPERGDVELRSDPILFRPDQIQKIVQRASSWYINKIRLNKLTEQNIILSMTQMSLARRNEKGLVMAIPSTTLWMSNLLQT